MPLAAAQFRALTCAHRMKNCACLRCGLTEYWVRWLLRLPLRPIPPDLTAFSGAYRA